jgi:hypothetical protein
MKPIKFCTFQEQESPYFQAFFATKGSFLSWFHLAQSAAPAELARAGPPRRVRLNAPLPGF